MRIRRACSDLILSCGKGCSPKSGRSFGIFVQRCLFRAKPAAGVTIQSLFDEAGYRIFYGDGTGIQINRLSVNGVVRPADLHTDLSYTVNADCTGTLKELSVGATSEMFIAPNGDAMTVISTDPGHVQAYSSWQVGPK
jgi:hypothetical protein